MKNNIGMVSAALAFLLCLGGSLVILNQTGLRVTEQNALVIGVALYFLGKAVFVGAMLYLNSNKNS